MEASKKRIAAASDAHPAKRQRYNDSATGQRNALPGLDDSDNEFDDDLTKEAVMYLRGVRSEAASIPSLLIATKPEITAPISQDEEEGYKKLKRPQVGDYYEDGAYNEDYDEYQGYEEAYQEEEPDSEQASGGYYRNGVYAAVPVIGPQRPSAALLADLDTFNSETSRQSRFLEADDAFHASLIRRFRAHKANISHTAPAQPSVFGLKTWRTRLVSSSPTKEQIAQVDYITLRRCLGLASRLIQRRGHFAAGQIKTLGNWVWCLFAKIEDIVTLSSEEVAVVRDVGKAAIEVIRRRVLKEEDDAMEEEEDEDEDDDEEHTKGGPEEVGYGEEEDEMQLVEHDSDDETKPRPQPTRRNTSSDDGEEDIHALRAAQARLLETIQTPESTTTERPTTSVLPRPTRKASRELKHSEGEGEPHERSIQNIDTPTQPQSSLPKNAPTTRDQTVLTQTKTEGDVRESEEQMDAILDMVLTIVGEEFGQRDLLVARDVLW